MNKYPKTRQGLINLIISQITKTNTTYVSFCAELEEAKNGQRKEMDWFCDHSCGIHALHNSKYLLCLPISAKAILANQNVGENTNEP